MKNEARYKKTERIIIRVAVITLVLSIFAGIFTYFLTVYNFPGDFSAVGQIAAVVPSFAGVVLAALALIAYIKEEDEIRKLAEITWLARNRFLMASQSMYYSVSSDLGQDIFNNEIHLTDTWESAVDHINNFKNCLFETEVVRALIEKEKAAGGDGSLALFASELFIKNLSHFSNLKKDEAIIFRSEGDRKPLTVFTDSETKNKQLNSQKFESLVKYWYSLLISIEQIETVSSFEVLLRESYKSELCSDLNGLLKSHDFHV